MNRVVHWGKYYPPEMGGIESVTQVLASSHARRGHRVDVTCFTKQDARVETVDQVQVHRCRESFFKSSQPIAWEYWRIGVRLGRAADIVHLHAPNLLASLMTLRLGRAPRLIVHWHSDIVGKGWLGLLSRPIEYLMLRRADVIVCTSPPYAEHSRTLRPWLSKVCCVPIGIPEPSEGGAAGEISGEIAQFLQGRKLVLAVGRLVPYKGFHDLVEAACCLPPDAAVVIAGDGPLREKLARQVQALGLGSRVMFAGRVPDPVMDALYTAARVFCLPSVERSEAFGVVLLEAMARGIPVVATNIPGSGVSWVNKHGVSGLNVRPRDSQALAKACADILGDPILHAQLANGARAQFRERFGAETFSLAMLNIYRFGCGSGA